MLSRIPQLNQYQWGLLCDVAQAPAPIFLLPSPKLLDMSKQRYNLLNQARDINKLVEMELIEDVTSDFKEEVLDQLKTHGRKYRVFGLTGYASKLFQDCADRYVN